jgi:hypothetical protein
LNPKIATKKPTDFKVDTECELQNLTKQATPRPKMDDFELGVNDDDAPITGVLIKCHRGRKDNIFFLEEDITAVYLVHEAIKNWCEGADMENTDVRDMTGEVRYTLYIAKAYPERALELFFQGKKLRSKVP